MKVYDIRRSGNIMIVDYVDEEHNHKEEEYILGYDHMFLTYSDIYPYISDKNIDSGTYATAVLLNEKDAQETYVSESSRGYHKNAVLLFIGEEENILKKKIKPFIAKKKKVDKKLKVIDFEISGRQMKLYLGKPDCTDYWGDDWDDRPYEHNAGTVYDYFVEETIVVNFPQDQKLTEICEGYCNSPFCKEDFKNGKPFAYIENQDEDYSMNSCSRHNIFDNKNVKKFYYETPVGEFYKAGYIITN